MLLHLPVKPNGLALRYVMNIKNELKPEKIEKIFWTKEEKVFDEFKLKKTNNDKWLIMYYKLVSDFKN